MDERDLKKFYRNGYILDSKYNTQLGTIQNSGMVYNFQTLTNFVSVSQKKLENMRQQGIHLVKAEPEDLRYTFSDFHKAKKLSHIDKK